MSFEEGAPYTDSDADDEYERSMGDASFVGDSEASPADSDPSTTAEPTPTTYAYRSAAAAAANRFPSTIITDWSSDECAGFVSGIGLPQYADRFTENVILGEALVALQHDDLKSMGIASVGHRLTILKSVYDVKVAQEIPIEGDHYLPFAAEAESRLASATLKDVERLVDQLRLRDERMSLLEQDLRRTADDFKRLREDVLPALRLAKDAQQPLPNLSGGQPYGYEPPPSSSPGPTPPPPPPPPPPGQMAASSGPPGVKRQYSQRKNLMGVSSKSASPTQPTHERTIAEQALDPSTGVLDRNLLPAHMTAMNGSGAGASANMPSPTSPQNQAGGATTLASRSYRGEVPTPYGRTTPSENEHPAYSSRDKPPPGRRRETPAPDTPGTANSAGAGGGANSGNSNNNNNNNNNNNSSSSSNTNTNNGGSSSNSNNNSNASVEIFKSFRVSMDDPCYKVLPAALKKYQINAPWDQYALYIVYGDQERCLGMEEKPLILFKQLDKEGKKPMFMLRKTNTALDGDLGVAGGARGTSTGHDPPGGII